jgi:hypothetical protein
MTQKVYTPSKLRAELRYKLEQVAENESRTISNMVEMFVAEGIKRYEAAGFKFKEIEPEGGRVVGKGVDEELEREFRELEDKARKITLNR